LYDYAFFDVFGSVSGNEYITKIMIFEKFIYHEKGIFEENA